MCGGGGGGNSRWSHPFPLSHICLPFVRLDGGTVLLLIILIYLLHVLVIDVRFDLYQWAAQEGKALIFVPDSD